MAVSQTDAALLDNPVWNALRGPLARFAAPGATPRAIRFDPEISFFCAVDTLDAAGWAAQAELIGAGGFTVLARPDVPAPPEAWTETFREPLLQFVAEVLPPAPEIETRPLGAADVDEMLALIELTEPGPFFRRTIELGGYIGVHRGGRLVAMAGRRFQVPGWVEISAVCTHPDARREGLAAALTLRVAEGIRAAGKRPFLHTLASNVSAVRVYEALGFELRRELEVVAAQWGESAT